MSDIDNDDIKQAVLLGMAIGVRHCVNVVRLVRHNYSELMADSELEQGVCDVIIDALCGESIDGD